jgi:hypothetical protein
MEDLERPSRRTLEALRALARLETLVRGASLSSIAPFVALPGAAAEGVLRANRHRCATTGRIDPDLLPPAHRTGPLASLT